MATFAQHDHCRLAQWRLAAGAHRWPVLHHHIWRSDEVKRLPAMPELSARLLPALLAQAARLAPQSVTARRFAAVVTVFRQPSACSSCTNAPSVSTCSRRRAFSALSVAISSSGVMPLRYTRSASPAELSRATLHMRHEGVYHTLRCFALALKYFSHNARPVDNI